MAVYEAPAPEPGGKLPDCRGLALLRGAGWSYEDIQVEYGVTNQSVHRKLRLCGLADPHVDYSEILPWAVRPEHRRLNLYTMLKAAARGRMGILRPLSPAKQRELDNFLAKLEANDAVVAYGSHRTADGNIEFGFYFAPKRHGIDDWIIRKPKRWVTEDRHLDRAN